MSDLISDSIHVVFFYVQVTIKSSGSLLIHLDRGQVSLAQHNYPEDVKMAAE